MTTALATIEPLSPLATRPLQPLPAWVAEMSRGMGWFITGGIKTTYLNPLPSADQRAIIESSRGQLARQLEQTPDRYPELGDLMLDAIGELMLAKPHRADAGALRREATIRSFEYALGDVPAWATLRAVRNWHRGEVDTYDTPKGQYNCRWMPDPTDLRQIANRYVGHVRDRIGCFDDILNAVERGPWSK